MLCTHQVIFNFPADGAYVSGSSWATIALYRGIHFKGWKYEVCQFIGNGGTTTIINDQSTRVVVVPLRRRAQAFYSSSL
jgi:hypothetical protein